jgi:hypothetical protein
MVGAYPIAARVEEYLMSNYEYALADLDWGSGDPVEAFLFEMKMGHCEYFASAMVLLLRSLGIPARFINGFAVGEWNDVESYYVIRQQDAHSWVEACIDGMGWVTFDPTPPAGMNIYGRGRFSKFRMWYDSVEYRWVAGVVNYGYYGNESALAAVERAIRSSGLPEALKPSRIAATLGALFRSASGTILLVVASAIFAAFGVRLLRRTKRPVGRGRRAVRPRIGFYKAMLRILKKKGFRRLPSWAPMEFARRVVGEGGQEFLAAERVTEGFCAVRYGARNLTAEQEAGLKDALRALKRAPRVKRRSAGPI